MTVQRMEVNASAMNMQKRMGGCGLSIKEMVEPTARATPDFEAKGDYLTFVDGDDWIEPQMYETLLAAMMEQDADLAVCRYRKIYENRRVDLSSPMAAVFEGQELLEKYLEEDEAWLIQTAVWNKLWKRSLSDRTEIPQKACMRICIFTIRLLAKSKRSVYLTGRCTIMCAVGRRAPRISA